MKHFPYVVALCGITAALFAFRGLVWSPADASRRGDPIVKVERPPFDEKPRPAPTRTLTDGDDPARLAAECAAKLHDKARKNPADRALLEQAAAHYRACLSHAPKGEPGELFSRARKDLAQIERQLSAPPEAKPAPNSALAKARLRTETVAAPKVERTEPAPAPIVGVKTEELLQFAPDGSIIRKLAGD